MHRIAIKIDGIERRKRSTGLFHVVAGLFLIANAVEFFKQSAYQNFFAVLPIFFIAVVLLPNYSPGTTRRRPHHQGI